MDAVTKLIPEGFFYNFIIVKVPSHKNDSGSIERQFPEGDQSVGFWLFAGAIPPTALAEQQPLHPSEDAWVCHMISGSNAVSGDSA